MFYFDKMALKYRPINIFFSTVVSLFCLLTHQNNKEMNVRVDDNSNL